MAGKKDKVNIRGSISRFVIVALALVLILALAIWAIISLFTDSEEKTRYAFLNTGSINETLTADFLLLRNEDVIRSEHDGMFLPLKYEGEKLSKGEVFALILPESAADLVDSYQNTRLQILELSLSLSRDKVLPNSRLSRSQSRIEEAVSDLRSSVLNRDIKALSLARKEFAAVLQERSLLLKPETLNDPELNNLLRQEASLLNQLFGEAPAEGILRTAGPGWISYTTFSRTADLSEEALADFSLSQARAFFENFDSYEEKNEKASRVSIGEPVARLIKSMEYKLFALLPESVQLPESDDFAIDLNEQHLPMDEVEIILTDAEAASVLLLESQSAFGDLLDEQIIRQADFIVKKHSGMIVPRQSLYDYSETDKIARLLKIRDGVAEEVIVFVRAQDSTHAIIEGRTGDSRAPVENDLYVLNPWTSEAGSLLE